MVWLSPVQGAWRIKESWRGEECCANFHASSRQICARGAQQLFWRCALLAFFRCCLSLKWCKIGNVGHGQYKIFILRNLLYLMRSNITSNIITGRADISNCKYKVVWCWRPFCSSDWYQIILLMKNILYLWLKREKSFFYFRSHKILYWFIQYLMLKVWRFTMYLPKERSRL